MTLHLGIPAAKRLHWFRRALAGVSLCFCATAWSGPVSCVSGASFATLDPLATAAEVGDFTLACGGGAQGDPLLSVTLQSFLNLNILQDVAPTLSDGANVYAGVFQGANSVLFSNVLLDPFDTFFTISNIFVNASLLPENFQIVEFVTFGGAAVPINNPQQIVGHRGESPVQVPEPEPVYAWLFFLGAVGLIGSAARRRRTSVSTAG